MDTGLVVKPVLVIGVRRDGRLSRPNNFIPWFTTGLDGLTLHTLVPGDRSNKLVRLFLGESEVQVFLPSLLYETHIKNGASFAATVIVIQKS